MNLYVLPCALSANISDNSESSALAVLLYKIG